ncbi:MAG: phospholipase D-like domain-containing protein [Candidatus Gracilibacteria bacterium]|nr:phospholipase D-like domain-containing protein [Candidatus Gracilibacteria bacterium]
MKKILLVLLISFLLSSCTNEYWQFHEQKQAIETEKEQSQNALQDFSVSKIEDRDVEILSTPDKKVLDRLISLIETAKKEVYIEVYILTEKRIIQALKDAKKRGVDVRVVLEKNVFGATSINSKTFKTLESAGVQVTYDNSKLYNFIHTKLLLADDTYVITTGNLSYASFTTNREFYVIGKNEADIGTLKDIFLADFSGREIFESTPNLVISPINSRKKIETILNSARESIYLYAENFGDDSILAILSGKIQDKIPVTICMADPTKVPSNTEAIATLKSHGIDVRTSKKPIIHAKRALVDGRYSYIGSENYSTNSLDENREIGILTKSSPEATKTFLAIFESDCGKLPK